MPSYSRNDILLVRYPFTDLSGVKVRPAVVVNAPHPSQDSFVVPLTSRLTTLQPGEFILADWQTAGLNVPSAVKRGIYTIHASLIAKVVGHLSAKDSQHLENRCESG
jgi:mRNA interferase MazF